jgi:DinB superfamily
MSQTSESLSYPIGKFTAKESYSPEELQQFIARIAALPEKVANALKGLSETQLDTPYREGGWTLRQVAHHLPDSHLNAYIRLKWTLTEETPTIKAYNEKAWAQTPETSFGPEISVAMLRALHVKWVAILKNIAPQDLQRQFYHPDSKKFVRVDTLMGLYAWHGDHHLAHITSLRERMGW